MLYLTFDCNIWIYLLDDAWMEYNPLDYLEHWMGERHIQILLPQIIFDEWGKHREDEREKRKRSLKDFFSKAEELIPVAFIEDQKKPDNIDKIIDLQFERIENMISSAEIISLNPNINSRLVDWGVSKKAPLHKKSSVADAVIILSLFDFAESHRQDNFIFISGNTEDFFSKVTKEWLIHPHLTEDFEKLNIKGFHYLKKAIDHLLNSLPVTIDINLLRKTRIKQKIANQIHNPVVLQRFENMEDSYIENIGVLDIILKKEKPTKAEIILVLGLLNEQIYQQHFYKKVHAPVWFNILSDNGIFSAENNPEPIAVEQGFQIPIWEPLFYLEKIAERIPSGANLEFIPDLMKIIEDVSRKPKDNYRTWYFLIKILEKIPNDQIPAGIFDFVPVWLDGKFRTSLETMELCDRLFPKFLGDQPSPDDIIKAEKIFVHLFAIRHNEITGKEDSLFNRLEKYSTKADLHHLSDGLNIPDLVNKMAKYFSDQTVCYLGRQIKHLLLDFPNGITSSFTTENKTYTVSMNINDVDLQLVVKEKNGTEIAGANIIKDFEQLTKDELQESVQSTIRDFIPGYLPTDDYEDPTVRLKYIAVNDMYSATGSSAINKLGGRYNGDKAIDVFSLIFRNLLDEIANQDADRALKLLKEFCYNGRYGMAYYKRISLYIVGKHWQKMKSFFWQLLNDNDGPNLFSDYKFKKELFHLLQINQGNLEEEDKTKISAILDKGDQSKEEEQREDRNAYWQLSWYSALKDTSPFQNIYNTLSEQVKLTSEHFEQLGEVRITRGNISPFDPSNLLSKSNSELARYILSFNPSRSSDDVTVDGLAMAMGNAIKEFPENFHNELILYKEVYYIYTYHIFLGFRDAWKARKTFDWEKVLTFAKNYITDTRFSKEEFKLSGDGWHADSGWVLGAIGELLSEGTYNDENALGPEVLPLVKELLLLLVPKLAPVNDFAERNMDYPMYALNSSAGKVLRGLIDCALHSARIGRHEQGKINWEPEVKDLYESALDLQIIDAYILEGMYFQQFAYLDYTWLTDQLERNLKGDGACWLAFMGGFSFADPPNDRKLFYRLYPHYERAMEEKLNFNNSYDQGLNKHLVSYFFWGYETLETDGLFIKFLANRNVEALTSLINFIWQQESYLNHLDDKGKIEIESMIMGLWQIILDKYPNPADEKEEQLISGLKRLIMYSSILDERNTGLLTESIKRVKRQSHNHELIESLSILKDKGAPEKTAIYLADILRTFPFHDYISDMEYEQIIGLIEFLYQNKQKESANAICNDLAMKGHGFHIELYKKHNPS